MKSRYVKSMEYDKKYSHLPNTQEELIKYLYDTYNVKEKIESISNDLKNTLKIVLFEEPEGAKRPRTRIINRKNLVDMAIKNSNFIHIYSPNAKEDNVYMKRLINEEIISIKNLIMTPCHVDICAFFKTPNSFSIKKKILAEMGSILHISTPDFDNIAKKYCDMFNSNVWLDDKLCISGYVIKRYSIKPRVEITLRFADHLYTKEQAKSISKSSNIDINKLSYLL